MAKVLFFSPHSAIWTHAFPEALIAESLVRSGNQVSYVTCGRTFNDYCVSMSAFSLGYQSSSEEKEKVCKSCVQNKNLILKEFGFTNYDLFSKLSTEDRSEADALLKSVTQKNFLDLSLHDVPVGKMALYEVLLTFKRIDLDFTPDQWAAYLSSLKNTIYSVLAGKKILDQVQPDRVFVYNNLYSVNAAFCRLAENRGAKVYFLHGGLGLANRNQTLIMGTGNAFQFYKRLIDQWADFENIPSPKEDLAAVTDHYLEVLKGQNVFAYSEPREGDPQDLREKLSIRKDQKVLVAAMSSLDEMFSAHSIGIRKIPQNLLFSDQVEWVQALIQYVKDRPELFLVIRVHPREFPNKRENQKSQHACLLEKVFSDLPPNVRVNWPSDGISLYDLAEETDVFLSSWSSVGKEMSFLGIPVVVYAPELLLYPASLNYCGTTLKSFFEKIELALSEGWSWDRIKKTYRWHAVEYSQALIHIEDGYPLKKSDPPLLQRLAVKVLRRLPGKVLEHQDCRRRAKALRHQTFVEQLVREGASMPLDVAQFRETVLKRRQSAEEEAQVLKKELRRLVNGMYPQGKPVRKTRLSERLFEACEE
ncbi:capsule biosynthesis protein [bacterium]|nr:capsule biosynthesis protein [bacterium]